MFLRLKLTEKVTAIERGPPQITCDISLCGDIRAILHTDMAQACWFVISGSTTGQVSLGKIETNAECNLFPFCIQFHR